MDTLFKESDRRVFPKFRFSATTSLPLQPSVGDNEGLELRKDYVGVTEVLPRARPAVESKARVRVCSMNIDPVIDSLE